MTWSMHRMHNPTAQKLGKIDRKVSPIFEWAQIANMKAMLSSTGFPIGDACGLYWIYTKYRVADLLLCSAHENRIDIPGLARMHQGLNRVIQPTDDQTWWCVYSGKGGGGETDTMFDRIGQHFSTGTGCLALGLQRNEIKDWAKWGVQIVLFNGDRQWSVAVDFAEASTLERAWRLHNGWPLLCKA